MLCTHGGFLLHSEDFSRVLQMINGIGSVNMWYVDLSTPGRYLQPRFKYNTFRFMWTYQHYDYHFLLKFIQSHNSFIEIPWGIYFRSWCSTSYKPLILLIRDINIIILYNLSQSRILSFKVDIYKLTNSHF